MTLEASMLLPLTLILIWGVVYAGLFLYNHCMLHQCGALAAFRGSLQQAGDVDGAQTAEKEARILKEERMIPLGAAGFDASETLLQVKMKSWMKLPLPLPGSLTDGDLEGQKEVKAWKIRPVTYIRGIRRLKRIQEG